MKLVIFSYLTYRFNLIPINIPLAFIERDLEIHVEMQKAKIVLEKKTKLENSVYNFKTITKLHIKKVGHCHVYSIIDLCHK